MRGSVHECSHVYQIAYVLRQGEFPLVPGRRDAGYAPVTPLVNLVLRRQVTIGYFREEFQAAINYEFTRSTYLTSAVIQSISR